VREAVVRSLRFIQQQLEGQWIKQASSEKFTWTYNNAPAEPGNITIWGWKAKFDGSGVLTFRGAAVGTIEPRWQLLPRRLF
jgi:hypothetical protein